ncbi:DUF3883 domain-containing protein [Mammaliicoccus vitulinus]|uniref:DUF3883 domain-containing protein n=1 Tax=Mammaliicoccus vitulinus TaxID=71237 RepID=UPI003BA16859
MLKELKHVCNVTEIYHMILLLRQEPYSINQFKKFYYNDTNIIKSIESTFELLNLLGIVKEVNGKYNSNISIENEHQLSIDIFKRIVNLNIFEVFHVQEAYFLKIDIGYHVVRNFMIKSNFISNAHLPSIYKINDEFIKYIFPLNSRVTLEMLEEKLDNQKKLGRKAEEIILRFEQERLNFKKGISQVSDEDVTSGFDIISFNKEDDQFINRFIEVKAISNGKFYLSKNEIAKSSTLRNNYFLYLVKMDDTKKPIIIKNPYEKLFNNPSIKYEVENISYKIEDIDDKI